MVLHDWLPFPIRFDRAMVAGACLWSLALYLGLAGWRDKTIDLLQRWLNFAERSLYLSRREFAATRAAREAQNAFYASVLSILPFLLFGLLCNDGLELSLGRSWAISLGAIAAIGSSVYELGRRASGES